jgi:parallel beta-helix repeat protein
LIWGLEKGVELLRKPVSIIMLSLLVVSALALANNVQPVRGSGTIYIRADGSIDPLTAPISTVDNITYTLTDNINSDADGIVVERSDITLDGAGYTVEGTGSALLFGILLTGTSVTVTNIKIASFFFGIGLGLFSSCNNIIGNEIAISDYGIYSEDSACNNRIFGNSIVNSGIGIWLTDSSNNNSMSGNSVRNNGEGFRLQDSWDNNISGNKIEDNHDGVLLLGSRCSVYENNIANNGNCGIYICGTWSNGSRISGNNITSNSIGIRFDREGSQTTIYHNNFVDNIHQTSAINSSNSWDDGYHSGGNYWSDYTGADLYTGCYQNETGSDGIGDTPYVIDANNQDMYPLAKPYPWDTHDVGITHICGHVVLPLILPLKDVIGLGFTLNVSVFVMNYGSFPETLSVTVYANDTVISTFTDVSLASRNSTILQFKWDTTGFAKGNYTISANATIVEGETDTADNNFTGGWVIVSIVGDITGINGYPDGRVGLVDVYKVAMNFGTNEPPTPPIWLGYWGPVCDINNDGTINLIDYYTVCLNFGNTDP